MIREKPLDIEAMAALIHQAYLDTCKKLGWPVNPENQVPYAELSEDSKELDRASVRAVLDYTKEEKNMRELDIRTKRFTKVVVLDEPGEGGACHAYQVVESHSPAEFQDGVRFAKVSFQNGPVKENGVNGCFQEDLIAICIDRLRHFQAGPFPCRENALALTKLEECLHWMNHRTTDRIRREVEGTSTA